MKTINIDQPIVFLRIAWMEHYQGITQTDVPIGAGSYVAINKRGEEVNNFLPRRGMYYGYARIRKGDNINITRLGTDKHAPSLDGVTVVFFATNPTYRSQYIVGWYLNATIFRSLQELPLRSGGIQEYVCHCRVGDAKLLPVNERSYGVIGPGETNLWYPAEHLNRDELEKLVEYLNGKPSSRRNRKTDIKGRGWVKDAELRKQIEIAAMDATMSWFEERGFKVKDVHKQNKGWDLEASRGTTIFHLEVKGTQSDFNTVELTPNEYTNIKKKSKKYRLCVVSNALEMKKQKTDIFYYKDKKWVNDKNQVLGIMEMVSARITLQE